MTLTDKEKIKEVLGILEIKIKDYEDEHKEFFDSMQYAEASRFKHMKELLEEIKKSTAFKTRKKSISYRFSTHFGTPKSMRNR